MSKLVHLVDDDEAVRRSFARLLEFSGYEVKEYASGAQLLEAADGLDGLCILLDLNMPELDGFAITSKLAERSIGLPVVMMTGAGDLTLPALPAGVAHLLQKPFRRGELVAVLESLSERPGGPLARAAPTHG